MVASWVRVSALVLAACQLPASSPEAVAEAARGKALAQEGKYELAIQHYKAALKLDSHLPGLYLNLGLAYFKSKQLPEAAAAFEEAIRAEPANFQARTLLGMSYYGAAKYDLAAKQLKAATELQPDNLELRYTLAQSYLWSEQYAEAIAEFRFLLSKNPDSGAVHVLLGEVLDAANRAAEAIAEFEAAVKSAPSQAEVHFGLGYLYWKQQRYQEACREFEAELRSQPQHVQALSYLGDAEMRLNDEKAAEGHLRRVVTLNANARLAQLDLGILLAGRNESEAAVQHFRAAIRIDPSKPDAHYRLGRLWKSMGHDREAQAEFEQVKKLASEESPAPLIRLPGRKDP